MKCIVYKYEDIQTVVSMLNGLTVTGIEQARLVSAIADVLDTGKLKHMDEKKEVKDESQ